MRERDQLGNIIKRKRPLNRKKINNWDLDSYMLGEKSGYCDMNPIFN